MSREDSKESAEKLLPHGGIGQIEPVLEEVHPPHSLSVDRRPPVPGLGVDRFDARAQLTPRHDAIHLGEELRR
jgi:hypothetical protein